MRAYLYARLNVYLPGWAPPLPPASIRQAFNHMRPFFEFVLEELDTLNLPALDQALLNRYAKTVTASKSRQPAVNALLLKPIWHLYHYRDHLPGGGLRFELWPGQSVASVVGYSSRWNENRTARIPEPILTPLLSWALKYVQLFSADIFTARTEYSTIRDEAYRLARSDLQRAKSDLFAIRLSRVKHWLTARGHEGRGVPGWTQPMNKEIRGLSPGQRLSARQTRSAPLVAEFGNWLQEQRLRVSKKSRLGEKLNYIHKHWDGLQIFLTDGRVEIDSNNVENLQRPVALGRKNSLFAGHDEGGASWGLIASLIQTAKMNDVEPHAYLTATLEKIAEGHPKSQIDELLPWNFQPST